MELHSFAEHSFVVELHSFVVELHKFVVELRTLVEVHRNDLELEPPASMIARMN